jgi:DNA topoisomerase-1
MPKTLLICEKPDAAERIAEALSDAEPKRLFKHGMPYYKVKRANEDLIICPALGHLYSVASTTKAPRDNYPVWEFDWKPRHVIERGQKKIEYWIKAINELSKEADGFVSACDYDLEGSVIGYTILKYACEGVESKAKRMKFSTLTRNDLRLAYQNLSPTLDFNRIYAGMCRHEVDWLYGINFSRALTSSVNKFSGGYLTLSTGRVQGPTLKFLVDREKEIQTFIPQPYWTITATVTVHGEGVPAEYHVQKLNNTKSAAKVVEDCHGKKGIVTDINVSESQISPPHPFDLSTLQSEAYRMFHISPRETLGIAERLYLDALISYPRTSSQRLPASIGYREILNGLAKYSQYHQKCQLLLKMDSLRPHEGEKTDPAHPAVFPTGSVASSGLEGRMRRVYDLIVKRFMATFASDATRRSERASVKLQDHIFYIRGSRILKAGWIDFYAPYARFEETDLPTMNIGEEVLFKKVDALERFTQPPPRYNPNSLLRLMEAQEIGTKATRADIIDTLYRRGYVKEERMIASQLAFDVIELMARYCPRIIDVGFTRELEEKMQKIELGRTKKDEVVHEAIQTLKPEIAQLKINELEIGRTLSRSARLAALSERTLATPCPICGSKLYIRKSRTTGKRFIACTNLQISGCRFTLPLPQMGRLSLLDKNCPKCGFQMIQTWGRGMKPLVSCSKCYVEKMSNRGSRPT